MPQKTIIARWEAPTSGYKLKFDGVYLLDNPKQCIVTLKKIALDGYHMQVFTPIEAKIVINVPKEYKNVEPTCYSDISDGARVQLRSKAKSLWKEIKKPIELKKEKDPNLLDHWLKARCFPNGEYDLEYFGRPQEKLKEVIRQLKEQSRYIEQPEFKIEDFLLKHSREDNEDEEKEENEIIVIKSERQEQEENEEKEENETFVIMPIEIQKQSVDKPLPKNPGFFNSWGKVAAVGVGILGAAAVIAKLTR
jgi:hypothetical protein